MSSQQINTGDSRVPDDAAAEGMAKTTRLKRRGGARRGSDAVPGTVTDPQAPDGSRCAIGKDTTGRQETAWPGGGNLLRHPKGSNGGVHRGPDRQLRTNAVRSLLLEAMAKEGVRLVITPAGRGRRHRSKIPMALVENLVTRIQEIAFSGSDSDVLRLVFGMHEVFQPGKHERNGDTPRPRPATFVVAPPMPATEEPGQVPAHPIAPGTLVDANGQEYVG